MVQRLGLTRRTKGAAAPQCMRPLLSGAPTARTCLVKPHESMWPDPPRNSSLNALPPSCGVHSPVLTLALSLVASSDPVAFHAMSCTRPPKPSSVSLLTPFFTSQMRTAGSLPTDASTLSAVGCHCSSVTGLPCPDSVTTGSRMFSVRPLSGIAQTFTVVSSDPVASRLSLKGDHAVSYTAAEWPLIVG